MWVEYSVANQRAAFVRIETRYMMHNKMSKVSKLKSKCKKLGTKKSPRFFYIFNWKQHIPGADLGGGCGGRAPPPSQKKKKTEMKLSSYFAFKIILFTSPSVTSFLRGAPLLRKILDPSLHSCPASTQNFPNIWKRFSEPCIKTLQWKSP